MWTSTSPSRGWPPPAADRGARPTAPSGTHPAYPNIAPSERVAVHPHAGARSERTDVAPCETSACGGLIVDADHRSDHIGGCRVVGPLPDTSPLREGGPLGGSRLVGTTLVVVAVAVLGLQPPAAAAPRVDVSAHRRQLRTNQPVPTAAPNHPPEVPEPLAFRDIRVRRSPSSDRPTHERRAKRDVRALPRACSEPPSSWGIRRCTPRGQSQIPLKEQNSCGD
jgi:hypothetical protein